MAGEKEIRTDDRHDQTILHIASLLMKPPSKLTNAENLNIQALLFQRAGIDIEDFHTAVRIREEIDSLMTYVDYDQARAQAEAIVQSSELIERITFDYVDIARQAIVEYQVEAPRPAVEEDISTIQGVIGRIMSRISKGES